MAARIMIQPVYSDCTVAGSAAIFGHSLRGIEDDPLDAFDDAHAGSPGKS